MVHIQGKFYWYRNCSSPVLNFQIVNCFGTIRNCHFRLLLGMFLARTPEKGLRGWGHGISRDIEERTWKFQGSIKKEVELPGMHKKISCNLHGSWFLTLKFLRGFRQFRRISRGKSLFSLKFLTVKWQIQKFQGSFQKSIFSTSLFRFFLE